MRAEQLLDLVRTYATEKLAEARQAVEDEAADPMSARFMWGSIVKEQMDNILELLNREDR